MNLTNNKAKTTIAFFLVLTFAASIALPTVSAHDPPWTIPTYCYAICTLNPLGVNQKTGITFWVNTVPPTAFGAYGDRWTYTVEITKPDGSKETLGPITSDPIGGGYTTYTPTQVGTYTLVAKFAGQTLTGNPVPPGGWAGNVYAAPGAEYINDTYLPSESIPLKLIVQEEPIQSWSETPLPTQFWMRPINDMNRAWSQLAGNWLAGAAQNVGPTTRFGYGSGPESSHVMWATPMWSGGIMDARFNDTGYQTYHYEGLDLTPPIILDGKLYYNDKSLPREGWYCVDLYTGETLYFHNTTGPVTGVTADSSGSIAGELLSFGQIYDYESPNQYGGFPYLWSTTSPGNPNTWMMFDAYTGNYMCSIANVSASGTNVYGKDGSILYYNIVGSGANKRLTVWNTSQAIWSKDWANLTSTVMAEYWVWRPGLNQTYDGNNGFSLNVSIPDVQGSILAVREGEYVIGGTPGKNNGTYVQQGNLWALSLKPGQEGTPLWNITFTPPQRIPDAVYTSLGYGSMEGPTVDPEDGVFLFRESTTLRWWCYSLETGQLLWESEPEAQLNFYSSSGRNYRIYQGMLLSAGWAGVLTAYDITTGQVLWNYTATQVGTESPYGNYPLFPQCVADGKIYLTSSEHSPTQPLWRGSCLRCINVSNGAELWKISNYGTWTETSAVIADGFIVGLNFYDNQIYCFGKGPSATTVEAPMTAITAGDSAVIQGSVIDTAAGTKQQEQAADFPNGVPAVSDASMEAWMEYVYMQQPCPPNATGVEVTLDAIDPNGNFIHLGTTTSDMSGTFGYAWTTPNVPGKYTIIATFAGSNSYYASYAETYAVVTEAPATTPPAQTTVQESPMLTYLFVVGIVIIILAIAAIVLLLRRK
jgi:hypothetical protein